MRVQRVRTRKKLIPITQQGSNPKKKSTFSGWWWEPPKLIPIILSSIALIVSGLSWWESHRVRLINEEINRPVLSVSSIQYEASRWESTESKGVRVRFNIKLKNTGKFTAQLYRYEIESYLPSLYSGPCIEFPLGMSAFEFPEEILPGTEFKLRGSAYINDDIEPECREFPIKVNVHIRTRYLESGSHSGQAPR